MRSSEALGENTIPDKFPGGAFLLAAGGKDRPDAFGPLTSPLGTGALSDLAINNNGSDRLLGQIVGGLDQRIGEETQVRTPVFIQPDGNILRFSRKLFFRSKGP